MVPLNSSVPRMSMINTKFPRTAGSGGFTLIEMLVVIAIITILATAMLPGLSGVVQGFDLTTAGQSVSDQVTLARQMALAKNRNAEVRFYKKKATVGDAVSFRGVQIWAQVSENGVIVYRPATRVVWLREGFKVIEHETYSPLIGSEFSAYQGTGTTEAPLPRGVESYVAVRFRPTGSPEAALKASNNFVTIVPERETGAALPKNYYTVQIDPLTGRPTTYRP